MSEQAWHKASASLVKVQKAGTGLEAEVCKVLGWPGGSVVYDPTNGYKVQIDASFPNITRPQYIASVTYTNPNLKGHSNENKFQLKVGELILLKGAYPDVRVILVIGGTQDAWLPYVLKAFEIFFDEVLFLWKEKDRERLAEIGRKPETVKLKHRQFWHDVHKERITRPLAPPNTLPPCCAIRYAVMDALKAQQPIVGNPTLIKNPIAQICMRRSFDLGGAEWQSYLHESWHKIEPGFPIFALQDNVIDLH